MPRRRRVQYTEPPSEDHYRVVSRDGHTFLVGKHDHEHEHEHTGVRYGSVQGGRERYVMDESESPMFRSQSLSSRSTVSRNYHYANASPRSDDEEDYSVTAAVRRVHKHREGVHRSHSRKGVLVEGLSDVPSDRVPVSSDYVAAPKFYIVDAQRGRLYKDENGREINESDQVSSKDKNKKKKRRKTSTINTKATRGRETGDRTANSRRSSYVSAAPPELSTSSTVRSRRTTSSRKGAKSDRSERSERSGTSTTKRFRRRKRAVRSTSSSVSSSSTQTSSDSYTEDAEAAAVKAAAAARVAEQAAREAAEAAEDARRAKRRKDRKNKSKNKAKKKAKKRAVTKSSSSSRAKSKSKAKSKAKNKSKAKKNKKNKSSGYRGVAAPAIPSDFNDSDASLLTDDELRVWRATSAESSGWGSKARKRSGGRERSRHSETSGLGWVSVDVASAATSSSSPFDITRVPGIALNSSGESSSSSSSSSSSTAEPEPPRVAKADTRAICRAVKDTAELLAGRHFKSFHPLVYSIWEKKGLFYYILVQLGRAKAHRKHLYAVVRVSVRRGDGSGGVVFRATGIRRAPSPYVHPAADYAGLKKYV